MTTATPATIRATNTTIEGVAFGFGASASVDGVHLTSAFFSDKAFGGLSKAYEAAKAFLAPYEPSCPDCGTHFSPGPGARCDCGACRG